MRSTLGVLAFLLMAMAVAAESSLGTGAFRSGLTSWTAFRAGPRIRWASQWAQPDLRLRFLSCTGRGEARTFDDCSAGCMGAPERGFAFPNAVRATQAVTFEQCFAELR